MSLSACIDESKRLNSLGHLKEEITEVSSGGVIREATRLGILYFTVIESIRDFSEVYFNSSTMLLVMGHFIDQGIEAIIFSCMTLLCAGRRLPYIDVDCYVSIRQATLGILSR